MLETESVSTHGCLPSLEICCDVIENTEIGEMPTILVAAIVLHWILCNEGRDALLELQRLIENGGIIVARLSGTNGNIDFQ